MTARERKGLLSAALPYLSLAVAFGAAFAVTQAACGTSDHGTATTDDAAAPNQDGGGCVPCVSTTDCNGGVCAQIGGDSFCVSACTDVGKACSGGTCSAVVSAEGQQKSACVPPNACGSGAAVDAGTPPTEMCGVLLGPDVSAKCQSCLVDAGCQLNGCYGGWWCNTTSLRCQAPPTPDQCVPPPPPPSADAGPVVGTIGPMGGTVNRLLFAVVGDTRPAVIDDVNGYPTSVITNIFDDIQGLTPVPSFVISTGDYQFSAPNGTKAATQIDLYLTARNAYKGPQFAALGNHECTGGTTSNCGSGNTDGITNNYTAFMSKLVTPLGYTKPYYEVDIAATDKSWTAKILIVAANAWDSTQAAWLDTAMAKPTTYTFMVRHESATTSPAPPGVAGSEAIMAKHPYTLSIVGHTHSYYHGKGSREIVVGNGGAPLTSKTYGFALLSQRADGAIVVDMVDATTKVADGYFHFAVLGNGSIVP